MNDTFRLSEGNRQIARAAGTVMLAIVLGQALGLVRGILVARAFPATDLDAFFAANRVSETLFMLIAAGALGSAFIPAFTGMLARGEQGAAWRLASTLANLIVIVLTALALMAGILAPSIVRYLLAPGFAGNPALFALTVHLLRVQLASVVLFGIGGLLVGILNTHNVFFVPALTPSMYQLGLIFGVLVLSPSMGIRGLAWGVVIGAGLYVALQIPSLLRISRNGGEGKPGIRYSPMLDLGNAEVRGVLALMVPRVVGIGVVQLNFWVNTWLASQMQRGSVAGLQYGFSLMLMAQAAIAQSVAIAALPTFSAQHALGRLDQLGRSIVASLRGVALLAMPASAGLILLRDPIVRLLYQRGEFDAQMTGLVSWALAWFAAGLLGHSMLEILTRAFYAQHDTRTPVIVGACAMGLNVLLSFTLSAAFARAGWMPHGGLALANSIATAAEATTLYFLMRRRLPGSDDRPLRRGLLQAGAGTTGLVAIILAFSTLAIPDWAAVIGGVGLGVASYAIVMRALRADELQMLATAILRRLRHAE